MEFQQVMSTDKEGIMGNARNVSHPVEVIQKTFKECREREELRKASKTFGVGFAMHLVHERASAGCPSIGHLPFLNRHNASYASLTGGDLDFDFTDMLAVESEFTMPTHRTLDNFSSRSVPSHLKRVL